MAAILHFLLVFLSTLLVVLPSDSTVEFLSLNEQMIHRMVLPQTDDFEELIPNRLRMYYFYSVDSLLEAFSTIIDNYYALPDLLPDRVLDSQSVTLADPILSMTIFNSGMDIYNISKKPDLSTSKLDFSLSEEDNLGPFSSSDATNLLRTTKQMTLFLSINTSQYTLSSSMSEDDAVFVTWFVTIKFDFSGRGGRVGLSYKIDFRREGDHNTIFTYSTFAIIFWCSGLMLLVAIFSGLTALKLFIQNLFGLSKKNTSLRQSSAINYQKIEEKYTSIKFDGWQFLFLLTAVVCSLSSLLQMGLQAWFPGSRTFRPLLFFSGFSAFLSWLSMLYYLNLIKGCGVLLVTLNRGLKIGLAYLIGGLPIYLGYALFGTVMFSRVSDKFDTFGQSCVTLFALINGDEILDVFDEIYSVAPVLSRLYIYSYIAFFIYCMLNIFIQIMEGAYIYAKKTYLSKADPTHPFLRSQGRAAGLADGEEQNEQELKPNSDFERLELLTEMVSVYEKHLAQMTYKLLQSMQSAPS
ncbi:hypothetical protein RCL1_003727 [Eukaryota sp. TZLM3-RCL]